MLDAARPVGRLSAQPAPVLPVAKLVAGRPVEEAADLLPRLFSLCRAAQGAAARRALGLAPLPDEASALRREVLRDHLMKLCLHWPAKLSMAPTPLPEGWATGAGVARAIFGPADLPPADGPAFEAFLASGAGVAPLLCRIDRCFPDRLAATGPLPAADRAALFRDGPCENSVAGRQAEHPAMRHIEATRGRGPLWRATARLFDVADALGHRLPAPACPATGRAVVTAARGSYAVAAEVAEGRVVALARRTPTDHLLAPGGILERALAALPADREGLAPLLMDILDPCAPLRLVPRETPETTDA